MISVKKVFLIVFLGLLTFAVPYANATWLQDGNPVCTAVDAQDRPQIVQTTEGEWIVVWRDDREGADSSDVYAQKMSLIGDPLWAANGIPVCTAALDQQSHQVVADCCGGAIVAWEDDRAGLGSGNIYVQRVSSGGDVSWTTDGVAVCTASGSQTWVRLASDGYGGAFVVWQDPRSGNNDIYAQYISSDGSVQWTVDGVAVCSESHLQQTPEIVVGNSGEPVIIWVDARSGNKDIYAQKLSTAGVPQWTADGVAVCAASGDQITPQVIKGNFAFSGFVAVWSDGRGANWDIYAQRFDPAGAVSWTADGVPVCTASGRQDAPKIVAAPSAVIIAWSDDRVSGDYDIYAQKLGETGAYQWTADGVGVCVETGDQAAPGLYELNMVSDEAGGAVITWHDPRDAVEGDIYAQRMQGDGSPAWQANGVGVCLAAGIQGDPHLAPDGTGGAVVAWMDIRVPFSLEIYAQRIIGTGQYGSPEPAILGVVDVPRDQGGKIQVQWTASAYDIAPTSDIVYYSLWRAVPLISPAMQAVSAAIGGMPLISEDFAGKALRRVSEEFAAEWIANIPARNFENYAYTAVSLYDSMDTDPGWQYFLVTAHTAEQMVFYDSPVDSGYSVDNLSPLPPGGLMAEQSFSPAGLELIWDENGEGDFHHYALYRGMSGDFVPAPGNRIGTPYDSEYFDPEWEPASGYWYKLAAVDVHGNESGFAVLSPDDITGTAPTKIPGATYLRQNQPNPFNPETRIVFGLKDRTHVSLRIYDVTGRLVRVLIEAARPAGSYVEVWDAKDANGHTVTSGVYFYRLNAGSFSQTRKMVFIQ